MKRYRITVEGKTYEVEVEELGAMKSAEPVSGKPVPKPQAESASSKTQTPPPPQGKQSAGTSQNTAGITAPMAGKVLTINVKPGDQVARDDVLLVLEAMKMENEIRAQESGTVQDILVSEGASVNNGDLLLKLEARA